ncbi:MAG: hypothetical protein IKY23_01765 [Lachnospiraceae bacterium]|nr:hypothetical protein [Lachnospiraceae bacterium]
MKKFLIKGAIVLAVFIAALFTISNIMNKGNTDMTTEMAQATFPVITLHHGGWEINELHGYGDEMDVNYMRECITPLSVGRKLNLTMDTHARQIRELSFEVRSIDGERLIENSKVTDYEEAGGILTASLQLKDLIEDNKEYMLVILVKINGGQEIRYYTRVIHAEEFYTAEKLDYVMDFSGKTFDKEQAKELTKYLESSSKGDNTTFAKVDIHSSFKQVTWGDLNVERLTYPKVTIRELSSQTGSFLLKYYVGIKEGKRTGYFAVEEFYRVRYTAERMYLLDFERRMEQIFDTESDVFGNSSIDLGIMGDEVALKENEGGNVIAFVAGNRLFSYNVVDHKLAFLFGFYNSENKDERALYDQHRIQILNVDEGGNVTFMVYGYMNRGRHEGKTGISVFYYDGTVNTTEELIYIPYYKAPELLLAEVEQLSFVNRDGTVYLMIDNAIYGINVVSRMCETIVKNLQEGCYQVSDSNRMMVWQKGNKLYEGKELVLMNLNTGRQTVISAGRDEVIAPIGFMGEDLIYGIARENDIVLDDTGNIVFPMYCVKIQNETEGILKTYIQENVYVIKGSVEENQIILNRVKKDDDGEYETIPDDHIMNAEVAEKMINNLEVVAIDVYEKITRINLKNEVAKTAVKILTPKEVLFEGGRNVLFEEQDVTLQRYYVYGKGGMEGIFMDVGNAVNLAYDVSGVVVNDAGGYVWQKGGRSTKNQIMAIKGEKATEEKSALAVCLDTMLEFEGISRNVPQLLQSGETVIEILETNLESAKVIDLTGCSLDAVLYYVNQDIPVLIMLEDGSAVLLIGFNEKNTVVMNPENGEVYKVGMNDSKEWFEQNGNRFITYIRTDS